MSVAIAAEPQPFGPDDAGMLMTPEEFDTAEFEKGYLYELVNGVLIVSPPPLEEERDPNEELGHWLRAYRDSHPRGKQLDRTLAHHLIRTFRGRRVTDRAIWVGLGRPPDLDETPTVAVEFVSKGLRNRRRDYVEKRDEFMAAKVKEYWFIDRFERTMTVFKMRSGRIIRRVIREDQNYRTKLLPGFELPLRRLLALADEWAKKRGA